MRRFITTEKKRKQLNALWRKYDRTVVSIVQGNDDKNELLDLRATLEDFVYDNGGTLE